MSGQTTDSTMSHKPDNMTTAAYTGVSMDTTHGHTLKIDSKTTTKEHTYYLDGVIVVG